MLSERERRLDDLLSGSPSRRANAAAWLADNPSEISTQHLVQSMQKETVPRIRQTLLRVLEARHAAEGLSRPSGRAVQRDLPAEEEPPEVQLDIAALLRHELSPPIGWIRLAGDAEIPGFEDSKTNDAVKRLQRRLDGVIAIIKAGEPLRLQRLNLRRLLLENWPDATQPPSLTAPDDEDFEIVGDEGLLVLLLSNVYQNALDASTEAIGECDVKIAWGRAGGNFWVRVTNSFEGNRFSLDDVSDVGRSSKEAHGGHGMTLICESARRLGMNVSLEGVSGTATLALAGKVDRG